MEEQKKAKKEESLVETPMMDDITKDVQTFIKTSLQ